ncbi:hypothetical protein [Streptomyces phaeochromogenes]|uniref:hypothetical protein n=1 Tax=Streptomyces phaeochromogenes TaxID=1923 RepID=UPI002DD9A1BC|nr:hypothetical protein [Streptomyces phaeochromogenes]WRZ30215.1 hypothetical protein OG931_21920 [Streptomyces phaeochromogenes]
MNRVAGETERCEFSDLPVGSCAHCRGNTTTPDEEAAASREQLVAAARWFTAIYPGVCACCGKPFDRGTPIRMEIPRGWRANCCRDEAS